MLAFTPAGSPLVPCRLVGVAVKGPGAAEDEGGAVIRLAGKPSKKRKKRPKRPPCPHATAVEGRSVVEGRATVTTRPAERQRRKKRKQPSK